MSFVEGVSRLFTSFCFLAILILAATGGKSKIDSIDYWKRWNRLNYYYCIHSTAGSLTLRLGLAHYWQQSNCLKSPSMLQGYCLSVNRSDHTYGTGGLINPVETVSYHIPLSLADHHFERQLLPALFEGKGWNEENEVIGVWCCTPDKKSDDQTAEIRIDLGQSRESALFQNIMNDITIMLGSLVKEEMDLNVKIAKGSKKNLLEGCWTTDKDKDSTEDQWILAIRDSHVIVGLDITKGHQMILLFDVIDWIKGAGRIILTKRSLWPFDTESHPLRVSVAWYENFVLCPMVILSNLQSVGDYDGSQRGNWFSENNVLAFSFEPSGAPHQPTFTLWLANDLSLQERDHIISVEKQLLTRMKLHSNFVKIDRKAAREGWNSFYGGLHIPYDTDVRHPYKMLIMNMDTEKRFVIKRQEDFEALEAGNGHTGGYTMEELKKSRLVYFHEASPRLMDSKKTILALTCTCDSSFLPDLMLACDWLVSHANAIFYSMQTPPCAIFIEPMLAEFQPTNVGKGKRTATRLPATQNSRPILLSRFHFILPPYVVVLGTGVTNGALSTFWLIVHLFMRATGIPDPVQLHTIDSTTLSGLKRHESPGFAEKLELNTSVIAKAVTGPSQADLAKGRQAMRQPKLSLKQLQERALKKREEHLCLLKDIAAREKQERRRVAVEKRKEVLAKKRQEAEEMKRALQEKVEDDNKTTVLNEDKRTSQAERKEFDEKVIKSTGKREKLTKKSAYVETKIYTPSLRNKKEILEASKKASNSSQPDGSHRIKETSALALVIRSINSSDKFFRKKEHLDETHNDGKHSNSIEGTEINFYDGNCDEEPVIRIPPTENVVVISRKPVTFSAGFSKQRRRRAPDLKTFQ